MPLVRIPNQHLLWFELWSSSSSTCPRCLYQRRAGAKRSAKEKRDRQAAGGDRTNQKPVEPKYRSWRTFRTIPCLHKEDEEKSRQMAPKSNQYNMKLVCIIVLSSFSIMCYGTIIKIWIFFRNPFYEFFHFWMFFNSFGIVILFL